MRQTACAWWFLPAMIPSGTWEGAHAWPEATGVCQPARRRGGSVAAPHATQQPGMPVIGVLGGGSPATGAHLAARLRQGLADGGSVEGRNVAVEYRWVEGQYDQLPAMAAELVRNQVAVIIALSTPPALAAKAATATIPIVFGATDDPVEARTRCEPCPAWRRCDRGALLRL